MTTYQMTMTKSAYNGWHADTVIPMGTVEITSLGEKKLVRRVLEISTSKRRPGFISSFASVSTIEDRTSSDGKSYSMKTMEIFGDYARHFNPTPAKTATEKAVKEAHIKALDHAETLLAEAIAYYAAKAA
jgi:hypothetical protein